jgi:hypothetical protein
MPTQRMPPGLNGIGTKVMHRNYIMKHLINYRQNVKFWTFRNYYGIKGRLSAKGCMCQSFKQQCANKNKK